MGHRAGWVAFIPVWPERNIILIPEIPYDIDVIAGKG